MFHYNAGIFTTTSGLFDIHWAYLFVIQPDLHASTLLKSQCAPASSLAPSTWAHFLAPLHRYRDFSEHRVTFSKLHRL